MSIIINEKEYKDIGIIGRGGFGIVHKLEKDNKYYAFKKIFITYLSKEEVNNYLDEAKILSQFNNEYIVKYYYSFIEKDSYNILMEFAGNSNLKQFIIEHKNKNQLIEQNVIIDIITQICLGLKEIHKNKLIHRDLTPENIFINENNKIKIGDFGVSKRLDTTNQFAFTGTGKHHYNAPEVEKGERYNYKADIYSLGCIIYELFTLNEYYLDKLDEKECKIDTDIFDPKWQELIELLLKRDYNKRPSIEEVYNKYLINNEIMITLEIKEDDIENKIYFFDNWHNHDHLKEMNELNTKVNIEGINYEKFFVPKKKGTYNIKIVLNFLMEDCSYMFYRCCNIKSINLSKFNSKNVTNMSYMFCECDNLENINLSSFNTEKVINMRNMFYNCNNLKKIDLFKFNTKNVTNMSHMFYGCYNLKNIDLSSFDTQNVTNMSYMFYKCINLKSIDLSGFNFTNIINLNKMFSNCINLENINLTSYSNVLNEASKLDIFNKCNKLIHNKLPKIFSLN